MKCKHPNEVCPNMTIYHGDVYCGSQNGFCPLKEEPPPETNADRIRAMSDDEKRTALIDYFSRWAGIGDSYIFDLTRVKEAFAIGTMDFDYFVEWDEERIAMLVDEFLYWLQQPAEDDDHEAG